MPTAAIYARFSTSNQKDTSIEDQVRRCRVVADRYGYDVPEALVFSDAAISGSEKSTLKREGYTRLKDAWKEGLFDCLIIDELSRVSRSTKEIILLNEYISKTKVRFLTADGTDSSVKNWKMPVVINAAFAEDSLEKTAFRVRRGMRGQLDRGFDVFSPPYGYDAVAVGSDGQPVAPGHIAAGMKWFMNRQEADVVATMFHLRKSGRSFNQICNYLNTNHICPPRSAKKPGEKAYWRPGTVKRLIANTVFRGVFIASDNELSETNPVHREKVLHYSREDLRIVDDDTWNSCNRKSGTRALYCGGKNALSGLVDCGLCGAKLSLSGKGKNGNVQSFQCASCAQRKTVGHSEKATGPGCTALAGVEAMLKFVLSSFVRNPAIQTKFRDRLQKKLADGGQGDLTQLEEECRQAKKSYSRALELLNTLGDDDHLCRKIAALNTTWKMLESRFQRQKAEGGHVDPAVLQQQLTFDPEKAVAHIFDANVAPEKLRILLRGIFPRITALGKTSRFVSRFEVEVCPGAVAAEVTGTQLQDKYLLLFRLSLTALHRQQDKWRIDELPETHPESQEDRVA